MSQHPELEGYNLSPAEYDVFKLVAEGFTNAEIGVILGKSESTVKTQVASILSKYGAKTKAHAVHLAHLEGTMP